MPLQAFQNKDLETLKSLPLIKWGIIAILGICLNLVLLSGAIYFGATDTHFYLSEFEKLNATQKTGLSQSDLEKVSQRLSDYVGLKTTIFSEEVSVEGQRIDFFNDKERAHMVDVRGLFVLNVGVGIGALAVLILLLPKKGARNLPKKGDWPVVLTICSVVTVVFAAGLGLLMVIDFSSAFIAFHKLFFTNDLWLLDPATDRMIVLLEEQFFLDIAVHIVTIYSAITLPLGLVGIVLNRLKRQHN